MATIQDLVKKEKMFSEFPFLWKFFKPQNIKSVTVKCWDQELLSLGRDFGCFSDLPSRAIYLLDSNYDIVARVAQREKWYAWLNPLRWVSTFDESVNEALVALGAEAQRISFVIVENYSEGLVVYKPAKGFSNMKDWIEALLQNERAG